MTKPAFFVLIGILAIVFASTSVRAQSFTNYVTGDGHEFAVRVLAEKSTIMLGETTFLSFEIKNLSDKPLSFLDGGDYRNRLGRPERFSVTVTHEDGTPVPQPEIDYSMGGLIGYQTVRVNGNYVRKLFLPNWATFSTPGNYDITVERSLSISARDERADVFDSKNKVASVRTKVHTKVTVVETDDTMLGSVIDSLGNSMLHDRDRYKVRDSLRLLEFIQDHRTLAYWLRALNVYSKAPNPDSLSEFGSIPSIVARFDTEESMLALEDAARSRSGKVRQNVANALRFSESPRALTQLLRMQNDTNWRVRIEVVRELGKLETDDSTERLRSMLSDENEYVWEAAEGYLKARNKMPEDFPLRPMATLNCPIRQTRAVTSLQESSSALSKATGESSFYVTHKCDKALSAFLVELTIAQGSGDKFREAWVLRQIGDIYNKTKRFDDARKFYQLALPLLEQLRNDSQRSVLHELGTISEMLNDFKAALGFRLRELELLRSKSGERADWDEIRVLERIAYAYFKLEDDLNWFKYLNEILNSERKRGYKFGEREALIALGRAYERRGRAAEAVESFRAALEVDLGRVSSTYRDRLIKEDSDLREAISRLKQ